MLTQAENDNRRDPRAALWRILEAACFGALLLLLLTKGTLIDRLGREYITLACLAGWAVGMLSYRQDVRYRDPLGFAIPSQILAVVSLIALVVFGFTRRSWPNFLIALPLVWLHIQLTRRWWARPSAWW